MKTIGYWIEAMRLRTLPVSVAGVVMAVAYNLVNGTFDAVPAVICLLFAVLAQIASNFANEYFDFKAGRDRPGREGPRRGVTEGEITPAAMRRAVYISLGLACCLGLSLVAWSGWWLIAVGVLVAVGVFAYSAGPYPLSTHGWGEVAVVFFFGIIPVNFTYYLQAHAWEWNVFLGSVGVGLMGANVLIINNYRDVDDDRRVDKRTLCVRWGRPAMRRVYIIDAMAAAICLGGLWSLLGDAGIVITSFYVGFSVSIATTIGRCDGSALNPFLGRTAVLMFLAALASAVAAAIMFG